MATEAPGSPARVMIHDVARADSVTAENIRRTAHELGYRSESAARALPTARTNVIAILVTNISNPYFGDVTRGCRMWRSRRITPSN